MRENHPAELLPRFGLLAGTSFEYEFSKYIYVPQSTSDDREYVKVSSENAAAAVEPLLASLGPKQELALHSRLLIGGAWRHIPMLDLASHFSEQHLHALRGLMAEFGIGEFAVYHSGRSAHVYGLSFLGEDELRKFFARALLLNLPEQAPLVDSRWIGHRLYAGYGSLRWSCNTKQYLSWPKAIGIFRS